MKLLDRLLGIKEAPIPAPYSPGWDRWLCGDITKFCGHELHESCQRAGGHIVMLNVSVACLCPCHSASQPFAASGSESGGE